jgi:hypothetical protein
MLRITIVCVVTTTLIVLFINGALARGRSFPIEVSGTIVGFDRANQSFTIRVDEPARVLTIGVGRDCKFKLSGATTTEQIIKPHAHVKVSYFATIFTGNIAVEIELQPRVSTNR